MERALWLWYQNLMRTDAKSADWKSFIGFAHEWSITTVIIWFPHVYLERMDANWRWPPRKGAFGHLGKEIVACAHQKSLKAVFGFALNGYDTGQMILAADPALAATVPPHLQDTEKGRVARETVFCPSKGSSREMLEELLLIVVDEVGVDGLNFECGEVDYVTCHCPVCLERFQSSGEGETEGKSSLWVLEQLNPAVAFLQRERPGLLLSTQHIYEQVTDPHQLNREIAPQCTVLWCGYGTFPDLEVCRQFSAERDNVGYLMRLHGLVDVSFDHLRALAQVTENLAALKPKLLYGRAWIPRGWNAAKCAVFAETARKPFATAADLEALIRRVQLQYQLEEGAADPWAVPPGDYNAIPGEWGQSQTV
jgi:hypothetical protein